MKKTARMINYTMFVLFLLALTFVVVFKANIHLLTQGGFEDARNISFDLYWNSRETLLNMAGFVPVGLFVTLLSEKKSLLRAALAGFLVSLAFETLQYVLMVGTSDLVDLFANTLGSVVGYLIYRGFAYFLQGKTDPVLGCLTVPATLVFCYFALFVFSVWQG